LNKVIGAVTKSTRLWEARQGMVYSDCFVDVVGLAEEARRAVEAVTAQVRNPEGIDVPQSLSDWNAFVSDTMFALNAGGMSERDVRSLFSRGGKDGEPLRQVLLRRRKKSGQPRRT
jgi:hypothetical protein